MAGLAKKSTASIKENVAFAIMLQFSFNYIKSVVNFNKSLYSYSKEAMQKTNTNIKIMMLFTAN